MQNSLFIDNRIERTKLRILQNEPAGKIFFYVKLINHDNPNTY